MLNFKNLFAGIFFSLILFCNFLASASDYDEERQVFELVNQARSEHGLPPFSWNRNSNLQRAAEIRAREIAEYFSHNRTDGSSYMTALNQCGVNYTECGENIAVGFNLAGRFVFARWMNSQNQSDVILSPIFRETAIASFRSDMDVYWVQLFIR